MSLMLFRLFPGTKESSIESFAVVYIRESSSDWPMHSLALYSLFGTTSYHSWVFPAGIVKNFAQTCVISKVVILLRFLQVVDGIDAYKRAGEHVAKQYKAAVSIL